MHGATIKVVFNKITPNGKQWPLYHYTLKNSKYMKEIWYYTLIGLIRGHNTKGFKIPYLSLIQYLIVIISSTYILVKPSFGHS